MNLVPLRSLLFVLVSVFSAAHAQTVPVISTTILPAAALQKDVQVLRRSYESLHPGLYRYSSKAEMDTKFDQLAKRLDKDQSLADAYLAFSEFAAEVKCGHTYANFSNQTDPVANELFKNSDRVPFYFIWLNGAMVVTRDFTPDHLLPVGTEVLAVNSIPTKLILSRLMTIARADGSNDAKRIASLAVRGDGKYETFDVFFPLMFPQSSPTMRLDIQRPNHPPTEISVKPLSYQERLAPISERERSRNGGSDVLFEWRNFADGSAYLRMPTWALFNSKWDWKNWLNEHLDQLVATDATALILDLRGNEGGLDVGNVILSRLVSGDLSISNARRLVRYRKVPDDLAPYLDTWDPTFKDWGTEATELAEPWPTAPQVHYFLLKRYDDGPDGDKIIASQKPYKGKVFVMIDSSNSSATFQFAQVIQQQHLGTLVGETTGGSQRGINGGAFFFLRLPESKIELDLPLIGYFPREPEPDQGIAPDVRVDLTREDVTNGTDAAMAAVVREIGLSQ